MVEESLNDKQKQFCREFIVDFNATQAAIRAGYSGKSARSQACELLTKPNIQAFLADLKAKRSKKTQITAERVLQELARIGLSDIGQFINDENVPLSVKKLTKSNRAAVSMVKYKTRTYYDSTGKPVVVESHELSLWDKLSALDKIGRHLGMWDRETNNASQPITIEFTGIEEMEARILAASNATAGIGLHRIPETGPGPDET